MTTITEADVEQSALQWLSEIGWDTARGADISARSPDGFDDVVLRPHLRAALQRLNPELPDDALDDDALDDDLRKLIRP